MANIKITMKDGTIHDFPHRGRAGGSYTKSVRYVEGFVIIEDEYGRETAFPTADVAKVESEPHRGSW